LPTGWDARDALPSDDVGPALSGPVGRRDRVHDHGMERDQFLLEGLSYVPHDLVRLTDTI